MTIERALPADRIEAALAAGPPGRLAALARELRDGGMPHPEILSHFEAARRRHASDEDQTGLDGILEVMDFLVGWCAPSQRIDPGPGAAT